MSFNHFNAPCPRLNIFGCATNFSTGSLKNTQLLSIVQQPEASNVQPGQPPPGHDQADEGASVQDPGSGAEQMEEGAAAGRERSPVWKQLGHDPEVVRAWTNSGFQDAPFHLLYH